MTDWRLIDDDEVNDDFYPDDVDDDDIPAFQPKSPMPAARLKSHGEFARRRAEGFGQGLEQYVRARATPRSPTLKNWNLPLNRA
jgi:hypothetical protein